MKLFKLIFSRVAIISFSILIQIGFLIFVAYYLESRYFWVNLFASILGIFLFFMIVSKEESSSFKIPWIIIIVLFPFAGLITYTLLGNVHMKKSTFKRLTKLFGDCAHALKQDDKVVSEIKEDSKEAFGQAEYLNNTSFLPLYRNQECDYLPTGEKFYEELLKTIKNAKEYIFLEYFIITEGEMWNTILEELINKVNNNVEVFVMYDDIGCIGKISKNYYKKLREFGIKCVKYNPYLPIIATVYNNRDHRKITVVDGIIGFVGGANLADEYINVTHPFGVWTDNAVMLKGKAVNSLVIQFIQLFNSSKIYELNFDDYVRTHKVFEKANDGFILPFGDGPKPFYNNYIGENSYLNIINQAKDYLYITTPYLIVDYYFINALQNAAKRGVDVRIITPHIPDKKIIKLMTKNNYSTLISAGVKIYEFEPGFIHSKMFLSDDVYGIVGTINLDYRSLVHHYETAVWMYKTLCLKDMKDDFNDLFENQTIKISASDARLKWYQRIIRSILIIVAPLM